MDLGRPLFQLKLSGMPTIELMIHMVNPLKSRVVKVSRRPWGSYMKLTSVQQAQITKYVLANGNYSYSKSIFLISRFPRTTTPHQPQPPTHYCIRGILLSQILLKMTNFLALCSLYQHTVWLNLTCRKLIFKSLTVYEIKFFEI